MNRHPVRVLLILLGGAGLVAAGYLTRGYWLSGFGSSGSGSPELATFSAVATGKAVKVLLSDEAIDSLKLKAKPMLPQTSWKKIQVPGIIVDRPGFSDRGVVAPVTSIVAKIHRLPGDMVKPGDPLFTLRLQTESLHLQTDLYKASQEAEFTEEKYKRLTALSETGSVGRGDVIELGNQRKRVKTTLQAYRQELQIRGLGTDQIDDVAKGKYHSEIEIRVPAVIAKEEILEVQEVKAELGKQVLVGETLGLLANHQLLCIEGRAFPDETPLLERSVEEGWPVEVDFQEDPAARWQALEQTFHIRRLSNTIDPVNRTFAFQLPLTNQSRLVEHDGVKQLLWRFRPGQKALMMVRVAKFDNMFELPSEAVAHDATDAFVFIQNVNAFERVRVRVVHQTRQKAVLANDGSLVPGSYVVQAGAAQLNRIAMTQSNTVPKGYHVHADGSLHKNEDEGK